MKLQESIQEKIQQNLKPVHLQVINDSHGHASGKNNPQAETHFTVVVVTPLFEGVSRLDRQRMVSQLLEQERKMGLHALSQKTFTPLEWEKIKDKFQVDPPACRGGGKL